jgi:hypothetical protein
MTRVGSQRHSKNKKFLHVSTKVLIVRQRNLLRTADGDIFTHKK